MKTVFKWTDTLNGNVIVRTEGAEDRVIGTITREKSKLVANIVIGGATSTITTKHAGEMKELVIQTLSA